MSSNVVRGASLLLGRCVPCVKQNASKIKVSKMELDENLLMVTFYIEIPNHIRIFKINIFFSLVFLLKAFQEKLFLFCT